MLKAITVALVLSHSTTKVTQSWHIIYIEHSINIGKGRVIWDALVPKSYYE